MLRGSCISLKVIVNEQGCHALLVCAAEPGDTGEVGCIARNRSGETSFTVVVKGFCNIQNKVAFNQF